MATVLVWLLMALGGVLALLVGIFCAEVIAALALGRRAPPYDRADRPKVAVLVPAHNESAGLLPTIADIKSQLRPRDRLVVVADNCSDDTAAVAVGGGAEVIERFDAVRIGKGYALDFGVRHLSSDPPEIVIFIDADCRLGDGTIEHLAMVSSVTHRPAQALDLMTAPHDSQINFRVAEFAWRVKNWIRPLGLAALNLPCQLVGTGMAIPWDMLRTAELATGRIVEDVKLGLDLALAGSPPVFCPAAVVTSKFPTTIAGGDTQRRRWEHGHIHTIVSEVPRFLCRAVAMRNPGLLTMALDLAVPPLTLLTLLIAGAWLLAGFTALVGGSSSPLTVTSMTLLAFVAAVALSWWVYGRDILPVSALPSIATYVLGKLGVYGSLLTGGAVSRWIRTDRDRPRF